MQTPTRELRPVPTGLTRNKLPHSTLVVQATAPENGRHVGEGVQEKAMAPLSREPWQKSYGYIILFRVTGLVSRYYITDWQVVKTDNIGSMCHSRQNWRLVNARNDLLDVDLL